MVMKWFRTDEQMSDERRRAPRYQLIAAAEIEELHSKAKVSARTSDVSLVGCFMHSTQSFTEGTKVRLKLKLDDGSFTSLGEVARLQPMGMGVSFAEVRRISRSFCGAGWRRPAEGRIRSGRN